MTWTVVDQSGNSNTCTQIIEVEDTSAPVIESCPEDINVNVDASQCSAEVTYSTPTFSDCSELSNPNNLTITQTEGLASGSVFPVGTTLIEFTATDNTGYSTSCTFEITEHGI